MYLGQRQTITKDENNYREYGLAASSPNNHDDSSQGSIEIAPKYDYKPQPQAFKQARAPILDSNLLTPMYREDPRITPKAMHKKTKSQTEQAFQNLVVKMNVQRFCNHLLENNHFRKKLRYSHHAAIDDKAFNLETADQDNFFATDPYMKHMTGTHFVRKAKRKLYKLARRITNSRGYIIITAKFERILHNIPVFKPESKLKPFWQFVLVMMQIYFLMFIPIHLAFNNQFLTHEYIIATIFGCVVCLVDLLIKLNTGFFKFGRVCERRWDILVKNINDGFLLDLASILVVLITSMKANQVQDKGLELSNRDWSQFAMLLFFSQGRHVWNLKRKVEEQMNWSIQNRSFYNIIKLLLTMIYIEHIFSCIWSLIGLLELSNNQYSWIEFRDLSGSNWKEQYLEALYFTTVTMTSVGYGDIAPTTQVEKIFCLVFMLISSVQLSYSVSKVGQTITELTATSAETLKKIRVMNTYMNRQGISLKLKDQYNFQLTINRISEYLIRYWNQKSEFVEQDHVEITQDLSDELKESLLLETTQRMVSKIEFLDQTFSEAIKMGLCQCVETVSMQPENMIPMFKGEDTSNTYLYYLDEGKIDEVLQLNSKQDVVITGERLKRGSHFGMVPFFTGYPSKERYRSQGFSKLLRIARNDLIEILKEYPVEYQKFCMKKDQLMFNPSNEIRHICSFCQKNYHSMAVCPALHFIPDVERIVKTHSFPVVQLQRRSWKRRKARQSALGELSKVTALAETYATSDWNPYDFIYDSHSDEEQNISSSRPLQDDHSMQVNGAFKTKLLSVVRLSKSKRQHYSAKHDLELLKDECTFLTYQQADQTKQLNYWTQRVNRKWKKYSSKYVTNFSQREVDNFLNLKMKLMNLHKPFDLHVFNQVLCQLDQGQIMEEYLPEHNLNQVIKTMGLKPKQHQFNLMKYMIYPGIFYERYKELSEKSLGKDRRKTVRAMSVKKWSKKSKSPIVMQSRVTPHE